MSGILQAIQAIGNVGGLASPPTPFVIGNVTLTGQEIPEFVSIGGAQSLKVHQLPGGRRVIDAMGRDDAPLSWSGIMLGPNAEQRMLALDYMRVAAQPVVLTFGTLGFRVVISKFRGSYRRANWVTYDITCTVVADLAMAATSQTSPLNALVGSDLGNAISSVTGAVQQVAQTVSAVASVAQNELQTVESTIGPVAAVFGVSIYAKLQGVMNALSTAQGVAGGLSAIANAPAAIANTVASMQAVGSQVISTISSTDTAMAGVVSNAGTGIVGSAGDLFTAISASSTVGALVPAAGYLNRSGANLSLNAAPGDSALLSLPNQISVTPESIAPLSEAA